MERWLIMRGLDRSRTHCLDSCQREQRLNDLQLIKNEFDDEFMFINLLD